ncbi:MAG: glycosyltransferase family 2 protein [Bryobacterales bacterium]
MHAALIIPALDEEDAIVATLREIPRDLFEMILVVDNGSRDATADAAGEAGAAVIRESRRGYGAACLAGIAALPAQIDVVVFMDADGSDEPADAARLLAPIEAGEADFVLGSRVAGDAERGALAAHQRFGNRLAVTLMRGLLGHSYSDLGPFRAIRRASLEALRMRDRDYGWTIEMQIQAVRRGLRIQEIPVRYRKRRGGRSKVSGNVWGSVAAGCKILWTVARLSRA